MKASGWSASAVVVPQTLRTGVRMKWLLDSLGGESNGRSRFAVRFGPECSCSLFQFQFKKVSCAIQITTNLEFL